MPLGMRLLGFSPAGRGHGALPRRTPVPTLQNPNRLSRARPPVPTSPLLPEPFHQRMYRTGSTTRTPRTAGTRSPRFGLPPHAPPPHRCRSGISHGSASTPGPQPRCRPHADVLARPLICRGADTDIHN
uniref:Uncharacterized protein n=1 Tax=Rousettus aegyptiacus TaxID=9407 RepID=A0A7J8HSL0_ROUAE|nr:hypothetical protein HJG63_011113 [Rousettus aegyptiacus]